MKYKDELVGEIRKIREEFESKYETKPLIASIYLREKILGIPWDKRVMESPKEFRFSLVALRTAAAKNQGTYFSSQVEAISKALKLCEQYDGIDPEERFLAEVALENSGLRISLELGEEAIELIEEDIKKMGESGKCAFYQK